MKFSITRQQIYKHLQKIIGAVPNRPNLAVLNNILIKVQNNNLQLVATDTEIELVANIKLDTNSYEEGAVTIPARKFVDICRGLDDNTLMQMSLDNSKFIIKAGRSRYVLGTLPAIDFPNTEKWEPRSSFQIQTDELRHMLKVCQSSMANQDVRYFLNGMLIEVKEGTINTVATDGHRLALCKKELNTKINDFQIILPRKGVLELTKLLADLSQNIVIEIGKSNIMVSFSDLSFSSKLIDGNFPNYAVAIPKNPTNEIIVDKELFKGSLSRAAILSNDKFKSVRFLTDNNQLTINSNNQEQESAEEHIDISYTGIAIEIAFNVNYLLDVINNINDKQLRISLIDSNTSAIAEPVNQAALFKDIFIIMPMRL